MNDHDLTHQHSPDEETLDDSRDSFEGNPNEETAEAYLKNARTYWHDGIISNETYQEIVRVTLPYLEDEPRPDTSPWIICPTCRGEGKHSLHLGAITQEDRERDWDPDDFQDYIDGAYDRPCADCGGTGKIREKAYADLCERRAEWRSENHHLREY